MEPGEEGYVINREVDQNANNGNRGEDAHGRPRHAPRFPQRSPDDHQIGDEEKGVHGPILSYGSR